MAERIVNGYKRLFEVRILHHYWLDDGSNLFDGLPENRKTQLLLSYDARTFLDIVPTTSTKNKLSAFGAVFKQSALGIVVAIPATTIVPDDLVLTFVITITDPAFYNYTALTFISHKIYELYYAAEDKIYRYKENVPVFSNLTGASRGAGPSRSLFLSKEIPAPAVDDKVEYLNSTGGALVQLTSSQPGAAIQTIHPIASTAPVFVHQNDTSYLLPPPGLTGAPGKGILLSNEIPDNVFGLINIAMKNPADPDFSCSSSGVAKQTGPVFQIRLKSRSAYWTYRNKNTGAPVSESSAPLPFTASGNAGVKRKPANPMIKVQFESGDPSKRIEKIYTEIFE